MTELNNNPAEASMGDGLIRLYREVISGIVKTYRWKEHLLDEDRRDEDAIDTANLDLLATIDMTENILEPGWPESYLERVQKDNRGKLRAYRIGKQAAWRPIETAPKKQDVLVFYKNSMGKGRISRAAYFSPLLHEDCDPYEGCTPNGEVDADGYCDEWLCPAGWYEIPAWQNDEGRYWKISEQITHWMPWPDTPEPDPDTPKSD